MTIITEQWKGGWFVGNFDPSAYKTDQFEVCHKVHPKGERWPKHYHKVATEINHIIKGKMVIRDITLVAGQTFIIPPMEVADPIFLEDCEIIVVKVPSIKDDKYEV